MKRIPLLSLTAMIAALFLFGCIPTSAKTPVEVSLTSSSAMDGEITSGGVVSTAGDIFRVGDLNSNVSVRGFLSFDLSSILSTGSITVTRAVIKANMMNWGGDPLVDLGNVVVYSLDYSTSLNAEDYNATGTLIGPIADATGMAKEYDIDVTDAVAGIVDKDGSFAQFRFQSATLATNNDDRQDSTSWATNEDGHYAPVLEITYTKK